MIRVSAFSRRLSITLSLSATLAPPRIANHIPNIHERAIAYHDTVCPKMDDIRSEADKLEMIVEDGLWTLPKYRELLFIR